MKSAWIAALVLTVLIALSIGAECLMNYRLNRILDEIDRGSAPQQIADQIEDSRRLFSALTSHDNLREVEVAVCDYLGEPTETNKSRLRDSVYHIKRLSFFSYFTKD